MDLFLVPYSSSVDQEFPRIDSNEKTNNHRDENKNSDKLKITEEEKKLSDWDNWNNWDNTYSNWNNWDNNYSNWDNYSNWNNSSSSGTSETEMLDSLKEMALSEIISIREDSREYGFVYNKINNIMFIANKEASQILKSNLTTKIRDLPSGLEKLMERLYLGGNSISSDPPL